MILRSSLTAAIVASLAGSALGDVKAQFFVTSTNAWVDAVPTTEVVFSSPGNDVTIIDAPATATMLRVYSTTPGSESIGVVTVNDNTFNTVLIGFEATGLLLGTPLSNACVNWGGLAGTYSGDMTLQAAISGDVTGDVTADRIFRLDIGGDIDGDVLADGAANNSFDNIGLILAEGDILGDIEATAGTINTVYAGGDIGTSTNHVLIYAGDDVSDQTNEDKRVTIEIIAADNIYADIVASVTAAEQGRFERIIANTGALPNGNVDTSGSPVGGVLAGSLTAYDAERRGNLGGGVFPAIPCVNVGDLSAHVRFFDAPQTMLAMQKLTQDGIIQIDGSVDLVSVPTNNLDHLLWITQADGLKGQIIINGGDDNDDWTGEVGYDIDGSDPDVLLGPSESQPNKAPFYERLSSTLGGGAIGLAPFNFHAKESDPPADGGGSLFPADYASYEVTIEHYGMIYEGDTADSDAPLKIEYGTMDLAVWTDVTDNFDIEVGGSESTADRDIVISPASGEEWEDGIYRVSPDDLKCAYVSGNPVPVYVFDSGFGGTPVDDFYVFTISADKGCGAIGADVNGDGSITPADFTAWIAAFNNSDPECDQNNDGSCDPTDFTAWIANYNMGCP